MSEAAARKDILKLQRAIVDGLEHVKAHDIRVFDTTHLSPLFERVLIASGASNRQTKAIAASVRDKVRAAGLAKPRLEGEENGEWIIIDCGAAVAHVMQPAIRQYYRLEEIWGDKPVRLKNAVAVKLAPRAPAAQADDGKAPAAKKATAKKATTKKTVAQKAVTTKAAVKKVATKKAPPAKTAVKKTAAKKVTPRKTAVRKT